jgi:fatty-acyl-CoA synthase
VYGLTETSPIVTQSTLHEPEDKAGATVGRPLPWTDVRIVDPTSGSPVPIGRPGEVQARGYLVMAGYLKNPAATAAAIDAEGWFRTGDLGAMDAEGSLNIVGRIKDMIIRGGENLYAAEIENVIAEHPAVLEACVIGVPDAHYGEELCAVLRLRPETTVTEREIQDFVRQRASHQKVPRYVRRTEAYPQTGPGKIQKFALREAMIEELGLRALASMKTA